MRTIPIVLIIWALITLTVSAQNQIRPCLYAGGGLALQIEPEALKDDWKAGLGFGGGLGLAFTPDIELIGKFFYNNFGFDSDELLADLDGVVADSVLSNITINGADFRLLEFGVDLKYLVATEPETPFKPYVTAGLGMANIRIAEGTVIGGDESVTLPEKFSETRVTFSGGIGFDCMLSSKAGVWAEGRLATVNRKGSAVSYIPIRAGVKLFLGK